MGDKLKRIRLTSLCAVILLLAIAQIYPCGIWVFELLQSFSYQFLILGFALALTAIAQRNLSAAACVLPACLLLGVKMSTYISPSADDGVLADVRVGVFNLNHHNAHYDSVASLISHSRCDVVSILEASQESDEQLSNGLSATYPYAVRVPHPECCYGISMYSKIPFETEEVIYLTRDPVIRITISVKQRLVDIWAVHTRPPIFPNDSEERNLLMMEVATSIVENGRAAVMTGDLNIVPWATEFVEMRESADLIESRQGNLLPTFPADFGCPLIPIDHILHTKEINTVSCVAEWIPGSDHKALIANLKWN